MIIRRNISDHLKELGKYFPIISLTGPRQAGKTTLLTQLYEDYEYVTLEDIDYQQRASHDPRTFLRQYSQKVIFDEAQRVPELFSYLQTAVDEDRRPGRFILSGSQNFLLRQNINQSLAGRVGIAQLFPLDIKELNAAGQTPPDFETAIFRGNYPAQFSTGVPPHLFYPSYIASYVERDVQGLISAGNLRTFQQFLQLCAAYAGQLLNYSSISKTIGVSVNTVKSWFSLLEQSYLVFLLPPYFRNLGKRIVKSPKLYFYDTGLLCALLGMKTVRDVRNYYQLGALFENYVLAERMKISHHRGVTPRLFFYRDSNQLEADIIEEMPNHIRLTEIKMGRTYRPDYIKALNKLELLSEKPVKKIVIYGGDETFLTESTTVVPWCSISEVDNKIN